MMMRFGVRAKTLVTLSALEGGNGKEGPVPDNYRRPSECRKFFPKAP
jgi:hypothetical protein